ncbi:MAG: GGDEF domain-containing protein [Campylobacterota bacterium]|nr:GGDEF domain-containing protein [Campylobacterota bacterium]
MNKILLYFIIVIAFIGVVNSAAYIQFTTILKIEIEAIMFLIPSLLAIVLTSLSILAFHYYQKVQTMQMYERVAKTDALTGILSRYACELILDMEHKRYLRYKTPFSIIMIDIDNFKKINDTYGHLVGDKVLCDIAHCFETALRDMDMICRWGGEEFIVILSDTKANEAMMKAEVLRASVERFDFKLPSKITISSGVCEVSQEHYLVHALLNQADEALYKAKGSGKNCVILA